MTRGYLIIICSIIHNENVIIVNLIISSNKPSKQKWKKADVIMETHISQHMAYKYEVRSLKLLIR